MKTFIKFHLFIIFLVVVACNNKSTEGEQHSATAVKYTCAMHPQIVQDEPGTCPICNMDLVKMQETKNNELVLDENQIKLANIKTTRIGLGNLQNNTLINARIISNQESVAIIASKFKGRIERIYHQEIGKQINKGAPLLKIYSEDLLALQKEYLLNVQQAAAFPKEKIYQNLLTASKNKLMLYGISNSQISKINNKQQDPNIIVYATTSGIITEINATEGDYISEGSPIFKIESLDRLWVEGDLYSTENIKVGAPINIQIEGFEPQKAKVEFVSPQLNSNSQMFTFRASINNSNHQFLPGMKANVSFPNNSINKKLILPIQAIIRDEKATYIWLKDKDTFTRKQVHIAEENESGISLKDSLDTNAEVVISGTYLLDSEYTLKKKNNN